jgi:hypothetical protein
MFISRRHRIILGAAILFATSAVVDGIILYRTGDPSANTTAPVGTLANSGWQYEGTFGDYLGTVIAPQYFITAGHIGDFDTFSFQGKSYNVVSSFDDPSSDLRLWKVSGTFPIFAPLQGHSDEVGGHIVAIGRGTQRGTEHIIDSILRGWNWGATDKVQRWGENIVADVRQLVPGQDQLYCLFDKEGLPDECHISSGDSGGGVFVQDGSIWRLAGVNFDADSFAQDPDGTGIYQAALFDERGVYLPDGTFVTGDSPVPSGFYSTRISSRIDWIVSIVAPRLANLSARVAVGLGDDVSIAGFIIGGPVAETKSVIVRGIGPSLQVGGVPLLGRLLDPVINLYDSSGALVASNDNWRTTQEAEIIASGLAPEDDDEAAIIADLAPGSYTAVLSGAGNTSGTGLVEVYEGNEGDTTRLFNLAARGFVGTNDQVLIGGVIVRSDSDQLVLRGLGPELADRGVAGVVQDPVLELHDAMGNLLETNDDWKAGPDHATISSLGLAPADPRESALIFEPGIGSYTAVLSGAGGTTGVGLLEAYLIDD